MPKYRSRTQATGPAPLSKHKPRAHNRAATRFHGLVRRIAGTITGNKRKQASGTRMMHGNNLTYTKGSTRRKHLGI